MNVIEFLKARLDEDEDKARAAARRKAGFVEGWAEFDADGGDFLGAFGTHLPERYQRSECDTPEHTLREISAKRDILRMYEDLLRVSSQQEPQSAPMWADYDYLSGVGTGLRRVVYRLATVYAEHVDYDERWRLCW